MQIVRTNKSLKEFLPLGFCLIAMGIILFFPDLASENVSSGIEVCFKKVIPSVFPFAVLCRIFISLGGAELFADLLHRPFSALFKINGTGASAFILGLLAGYPSGAVCTAELWDKGKLSSDEAARLCAFSNNSSPAFLIGVVGLGCFSSKNMGYILCLIGFISSVITGAILSVNKTPLNIPPVKKECSYPSVWECISKAVSDSTKLMLKICGTVIFFELVCGLSQELFSYFGVPPIVSSFCYGGMEISFAAEFLSKTSISPLYKAILAAAFSAWSGARYIFR